MSVDDPLEELFRRSSIEDRPLRRTPRWLVAALGFLFAALLFGPGLLRAYGDYLWYAHDARQPQVMIRALLAATGLSVLTFAVSTAVLTFFGWRAIARVPVFQGAVETAEERLMAQALARIQHRGRPAILAISAFFGLLLASQIQDEYPKLWWYRNAVEFGKTDPIFGLDLSFFVFRLPWIETVLAFATGLAVLALIATGFTYFGLALLAKGARAELSRSRARGDLSVLGGAFAILVGASVFFGRYAVGTVEGTQFTGPGFALVRTLPVEMGLAVLAVLLGLAIIANGYAGRPWVAVRVGVPVWVGLYVLGVVLMPAFLQRFVVEPDRINKERLYAGRAIEFTRFGYDLQNVDVRDMAVRPEPTARELAEAVSTLENMRLWDPQVIGMSFDTLQSLRAYYDVSEVDIDRYRIDGRQKMVMVAARNIDPTGLQPGARTWINTRLQYTHGIGIVMAPVNTANPIGRPEFFIRDIPPRATVDLPIEQTRLYFADFPRLEPGLRDRYVIVATREDEFDLTARPGQEGHRWTGDRGIPVGPFLPRLAYSILLGDVNLLISDNITGESRLLIRRNVQERARAIYRFLRFDQDPYVVLFRGRLLWIQDAFTVSDRLPYSPLQLIDGRPANYVRNSVKVVVDAYTGETTAYAVLEDEPVLRAYQKMFPGLIRPRSEIPEGLERHFRYAEDKFSAQARVLTLYHVTDPATFLNNEDAWAIARERGRDDRPQEMLPYYVQMRLPGEDRDAFMLILPFTPRGKNNMIGWMAGHCDPEQYGRLVLYRFPRESQTNGPLQVEAMFNNDTEVAEINRQLNNEQTMIVPGNLLVIPIGNSILYVKPLFLQGRATTPNPQLTKVVVGVADRVAVADTFEQALQRLFSGVARPAEPAAASEERAPEAPPAEGTRSVPLPDVVRALRLLDEADAALREGDFARYGERQREARSLLRRLVEPRPPAPSPEADR